MLACCMQKRGKERPSVGWEMKILDNDAQHVHQHKIYCLNAMVWSAFYFGFVFYNTIGSRPCRGPMCMF